MQRFQFKAFDLGLSNFAFGFLMGLTFSTWGCGGVDNIRFNTESNPSAWGVSVFLFIT